MRFHPTINYEQYRATWKILAASQQGKRAGWTWLANLILSIVCLIIGVLGQTTTFQVATFTIAAILLFCTIVSKPLANRSRESCLRKTFAEQREMLNAQVLTIDESGIACDQRGGEVTSHHTWKAFEQRIDTDDAYLFLPTPQRSIRIPKEHFSSAELEQIWKWSSDVPT